MRNFMRLLKVDLHDAVVYGYLDNPAVTTIAQANVYQLVAGPFTNPILRGFAAGTDYIYYTGDNPRLIKVIAFATIESNTSNNTVTIALYHNGEICEGSESVREMKFAGDVNSLGFTCDCVVEKDDTIQLIVKSNRVGSTVTFINFQTNLFAEKVTHE